MSQFPVTPLRLEAWPGERPLPELVVFSVWGEFEFTGEASIAKTRLEQEDQRAFPLSPEFYLRDLFTIDLDDLAGIERFISNLGFLFGRYRESDPGASLVLDDGGLLGAAWASYGLQVSGIGKQLSDRRFRLFLDRSAKGEHYPFELIEETRLGLAWLRDLARLWKSNRETGWEEVPEEWDSTRYGVRKPKDPSEMAGAFVSGLNAALKPIHPFVRVPNPLWAQRIADTIAVGGPPLYAVIASQLYNHVAENADYKRCQNETCQRLFVRQVDTEKRTYTAQYTSRPEATDYCSPSCRQAQKQRKWRREQKKKKDVKKKGARR